MSNCPQCGENVAELDIFCSFCGISLAPLAGLAPNDSSPAPAATDAPADAAPSVAVGPGAIPPPISSPFSGPSALDPFLGSSPAPIEPAAEAQSEPVADVQEVAGRQSVPGVSDASEIDSAQALNADSGTGTGEPSEPFQKTWPENVPMEDAPIPKVILDLAAAEIEPEVPAAAGTAERDLIPSTPSADVAVESAPVETEGPVLRDASEPASIAEQAELIPSAARAIPGATEQGPSFEAAAEAEPAEAFVSPEPAVQIEAAAADEEETALPEFVFKPAAMIVPDAPAESETLEDGRLPETAAEIKFPAPAETHAAEPADSHGPAVIAAETMAEPEMAVTASDAAEESEPIVEPLSEPVAAPSAEAESEAVPAVAVEPAPAALLAPEPAVDEARPGAKAGEVAAPAESAEPAAAVVSAASGSGEPRVSTKPNIGNIDTDGRKAAKLKPLDEGTLLNNRYEIVRKIGGGGMGAVYLANDRNLGGILRAVKEMVQSYIEAEQQDKAVADFQREAMILTNLEHPSIPTIFDYFFDDKEGRFYLVMKYISGGDLASRLRANPEGRLDEKTVTEWAIQVTDVLEYLHRQDPVIVYRDLKPANIMIDGNTGRLMLIDFGIARSINKEEKGVTAVGTMGYAPPELFSGNVEPRSDIYSLGSTMFHLLTGADPQSNPLLIFDFQKNPRPRQINPQLSDQIEQILMRAVEYNADLRFGTALEMKRALEDHLLNLQTGKVSYGVKAAPSAVSFSEQLVFCGFCGKQIVASDVFCAFCGSQQPIAQHSFHQAPVLAPIVVTAKLHVVLTNDLESAGFTLEKDENLIGRRDPMSNIFPEVDLSKYDPQTKISRRHARIRREGAAFLLEDLGSSNGTKLISAGETTRLLPHQPRLLANGDRFSVGDTTLQFSVN